ncbi:uncharacterized protein MONOS_10844 [Monocercomonoides exilis]|uniref:uncharacterized protein n=1 Tax=Monocercomonoides exilis TaxID=2049356 RepID=UPI00355AAEDD|nr:hypothetical protein MONOS_10844 [Monocercomonoides exilis]|eukprot:MONOS_10844.1-p1 / transcript=MONOS_10844.1 / gene=MONOS_10844 / organism=Monocercomonoides_exilis_PA203 / gene_product=unspecified product / transcript_product=unspecified product / location=Mono_scaffold00510:6684-17444(-) / protein_length=3560 / sequence_SO=supercontig / SO=protein_coding / is_pseudo=false
MRLSSGKNARMLCLLLLVVIAGCEGKESVSERAENEKKASIERKGFCCAKWVEGEKEEISKSRFEKERKKLEMCEGNVAEKEKKEFFEISKEQKAKVNREFSKGNEDICAMNGFSIFLGKEMNGKSQICACTFVVNSSVSMSYVQICGMKELFLLFGGRVLLVNISTRAGNVCGKMPSLFDRPRNVEQEGFDGEVSVEDCLFGSLRLGTGAPFLVGGTVGTLEVSQTRFENITGEGWQKGRQGDWHGCETTMGSVVFVNVDDVVDGAITESINEPSSFLLSFNCSFEHCMRKSNKYADYKGEDGRIVVGGSASFEDDTFTGCRADEGKGGALFVKSSEVSLNVMRCSFTSCYALSNGGAIHADPVKSVIIVESLFLNNSAENGGGSYYVHNNYDGLLLTGCMFKANQVGKDGRGSAINYNDYTTRPFGGCIGADDGNGAQAQIMDCQFVNCTNKGSFGALMSWSHTAYYAMRSCQFVKCTSEREGGAIRHHIVQCPGNQMNKKMFFFMLFHECSCIDIESPFGHDMCIHQTYPDVNVTPGPLKECYSTNTNEKRFYWSTTGKYESDWLPTSKVQITSCFVATNGNDTEQLCGLKEEAGCRTIRHSFGKCMTQFEAKIYVGSGKHLSEEGEIGVGSRCVCVCGEGVDKTVISTGKMTNGRSLFCVGSGSMRLRSLAIEHSHAKMRIGVVLINGGGKVEMRRMEVRGSEWSSGMSGFEVGLFGIEAGGGELEMEHVVVSGVFMGNIGVLGQARGSKVNLSNVEFLNVVRLEGDGSVMSRVLCFEEELEITNVTMRRCRCESGDGGGIRVEMGTGSKVRVGKGLETVFEECRASKGGSGGGHGGGVILELKEGAEDFVLEKVRFSGCSASVGGTMVFIKAHKLKEVVNRERLKFQADEWNLTDLCGFEGSDEENVIPLVVYLREKPLEYFVGGTNKKDWEICGFVDMQCMSVDYAIETHGSASGVTVVASHGAVLKKDVLVSRGTVVAKGQTSQPRVEIERNENGAADGMITTRAKASFVNLLMSIPGSVGAGRCLMMCESGSLEVQQCKFEGREGPNIGYVLVMCSGGSVNVKQLRIDGLSFEGRCVIGVEGAGGGVMCQGNITGGRVACAGGMVWHGSSGEFLVEQTVFEGVEVEDGGILVGEGGRRLEVRECTFSGIGSKGGDGSGIRCVIGEGEEGRVWNNSFIGCIARNGCGGGASVEISGGGVFEMGRSESETTIEKCESKRGEGADGESGVGGFGGGLFVKCVGDGGYGYEVRDVVFGEEAAANKAECGGDNIFVWGEDLMKAVGGGQLVNVVKTDRGRDHEAMGFEGEEERYVIPLLFYFASVEGVAGFVGGENARDFSVCGFEGYGCRTIEKLVSLRFKEGRKQIIVEEGFLWEEEVEMSGEKWDVRCVRKGTQVVVVAGDGNREKGIVKTSTETQITNCTMCVPGSLGRAGCLIESVGGGLGMKWCGIRFVSESAGYVVLYQLVNVEGGKVCLEEFVIEGSGEVEFGVVPFAVEEARKMVVNNSVFGRVVHSGSDGGCLEVLSRGNEREEVCVENSTFESGCEGEGGVRGGGMMVCEGSCASVLMKKAKFLWCNVPDGEGERERGLGGGMFILCCEETCDFVLEGVEFSGCKGWMGRNVFVDGKDLREIVKKERFAFEREGMELRDLMGYERMTTDERFGIPLEAYLDEFVGSGYVGGAEDFGFDHSGCGVVYAPCETIGGVVKIRFAGSSVETAEIIVMGSFELKNHESVGLQRVSLKEVETERLTNVVVSGEGEGEGEGEGLVETTVNVVMANLSFSIPSRFIKVKRGCLFACKGEVLEMKRCSVQQRMPTEKVEFCVLKAIGGKVEVRGMRMEKMSFGGVEVFEVRRGEGVFLELEMEDMRSEAECGLILASVDSVLMMENSSVDEIVVDGGCVLEFDSGAEVTVRNSSLTNVTRRSGDGGVFAGRVGEEKKVEVKNCTVMEGKCVGNPSNGGGVMVSVGRKGKFVFDLNRVEKCAVVGNKGYGGGVFVKFEDVEAGYSMKGDVFKENAAAKGIDVFVVSGAPDVMLREDLWMGSVDEESTPEENVWVVDSLTDTVIDLSVKKYLFPSEGMIVFIEAGRSTMADTCGSEVSPCDKFADGFGHMGNDKTTIQINNENSIESEINRKGISLAVRGRSGESLLEFVEWGCFVQDEGDGQTTLSLNRLRFKLPRVGGEGNSGSLRVSVGMMMVMNCKFGAGGGEKEETGMRIVEEIGGEVRMEQVVVEGMIFSGEGGIGAVKGGVFHMNNTNISKIVGKGRSLIEGEEGIEFGMWRGNIVDVDVERGGVMEMKKAQRVEIEEGNVFNGCRSVFGDGGGMKWEVDEGGSFEFVNGEVEQCSVNGESGRGGGVFVYVDNRTSGMIRFEGIAFLQNSGAYGRDMFLDCRDLNETVTAERFGLHVTNEEGREIVDMQGVDRVRFVERHVDLCVFLVEWKWREVHVSEEGCDMVGCGNGSLPCKSLWRGLNNVDRDGSEGGRIKIKGRAKVGDWEDVSGIVVESGVEGEVCVVEVGMEVEGGDGKWVFENRKIAGFERVEFCLPDVLERGQEAVMYSESESGVLSIHECLFVLGDLDGVGYGVLKTKGGSVHMVSCTIESGRFSVCPFYICSCGVFEECRIVGMKRRDGKEGGGLKATLADAQILMLNRTDGWECECSATSGRGGFLFVDSLSSVAEQPFQLKDVSLKGNQAYRGKSVFVVGGDLNKCVTGDSFAFDLSGLMGSENEFVGKEGREEGADERDLLRYVVGYSSKKIFVCGSGEDVKRCGSEDDPCFSMRKVMGQLENTREMKEVVVMELGRVEDEWDLANVTWRGGGREDEEESKDMLTFCGKSEGVEEWFVRCEESFCVKNLKIVIGESVGEEKKEVVSGRGKAVEFEGCRVVSEVPENGRILSFVVVRAGSLMMKKVTFERMKMRGSGIVAFEGVSCLLEKVKMEFETHFGGSGIAVEGGSNGAEEHEATSVVMNGTEFVMVEREDDGPSVMESVCTGGVKVVVNGSVFESCKARGSSKGGGMLLKLNDGGDILVKDGRIMECECSEAVGRGGGVYLWSELRGDLGFVFEGVKLSGNKAHVGRDVFIECVNISRQINESQFKMDLRAEVYIRGNGIYGIDEVEEEPVDLIELITVYQSSTIVVSNVFGKGGGNWRKCGTVEQPCLSVGYGLEHVVAGFNSMVAVDGESEIEKEIEIGDVVMRPKSWEKAKITIGESLVCTREGVIEVGGKVVVELVSFMFGEVFPTAHKVVFDVDQELISFSEVSFGSLEPEAYESAVPVLVKCTGGQVMMRNCKVEHVSVEWLMCFGGAVSVREMEIKSICCKYGGIIVRDCEGLFGDVEVENIRMDGGSFCEIENRDGGREMKVCHSKLLNVTSGCEKAAGIRCSNSREATSLSNCTLVGCQSLAGKGNVIQVWMSEGVFVDVCKINFGTADEGLKTNIIEREKICWWNGSAVDLTESKVKVEDTTIAGSSNGGMTVSGGSVSIEKGEFLNNNPSIEGYPSLRRNIICSDSGTLNVMSLKGGDGWKDNTSLWMLNDGCSFEGIASERDSSFFIPVLESVEAREKG